MKFGDIYIVNFMAIAEARVVLGNRGLVNVAGINQDDTSALSNGAGKSSFGDAISWCLFGKTARGDTGDAVVNDAAGKGCLVDVELLDGADQWKVIRHRKHKTGKNALHLWHYDGAGVATNLTQGTDALTQGKLDAILGCSYEVFVGSVYAGQEQMPDLPAMTDKNLKVLVEEAAGTTLLEKGHRLALDGVAAAKTAQATAQAKHDLAARQLADADRHVTETQERQKDWEAGRAGRVQPLIDGVKDAAKHAKAWAEVAGKIDVASLKGEIATQEAAIAAVTSERQELERLQRIVGDASSHAAGVKHGLLVEERADRDLVDRLAKLDHQVGCPCSGCGRAYSAEDIAPAKHIAGDDLAKVRASVAQRQADVDAAEKALTEVTKARDAFAAGMTDVAGAIAARDAAGRSLSEFEAAERNKIEWTRRAKERLEGVNRAKAEPNPFDGAVTAALDRARVLNQAVTDAYAGVTAAEAEVQLAGDVCSVFAPAGVRAHILDTVTPFLNDRTARYLGTLSDGNLTATWSTLTKSAKGELKEKFAIEVAKALGGQRFSSISGGEKRKVRIACALALQDLVASRATKPIELFIGDEIDDALDAAGVERLMTVLTEKARERGSVFVISHHSLKDWISQTITFTRKGGVSTVAGSMS